MLHKKNSEFSDEDYAHMRKVVGYVHRHLKQGGMKDKDAVEHSLWRLSLMNWGHDLLKDALGMDDPPPVAVTVEACGEGHGQYRWHLTDADGVSIRVSPEAYVSPEDAAAAGETALGAFGAAEA